MTAHLLEFSPLDRTCPRVVRALYLSVVLTNLANKLVAIQMGDANPHRRTGIRKDSSGSLVRVQFESNLSPNAGEANSLPHVLNCLHYWQPPNRRVRMTRYAIARGSRRNVA